MAKTIEQQHLCATLCSTAQRLEYFTTKSIRALQASSANETEAMATAGGKYGAPFAKILYLTDLAQKTAISAHI